MVQRERNGPVPPQISGKSTEHLKEPPGRWYTGVKDIVGASQVNTKDSIYNVSSFQSGYRSSSCQLTYQESVLRLRWGGHHGIATFDQIDRQG